MMARGYGRNHSLWRCHPQCDRCRLIPTPWVTHPTFGFVGIDGGGENYLPFHQPHSDKFMPYANHQQIWLISSPVALPPPNRFVPRDPHTMCDAPHVRFRRNRRGGRELPTIPPAPFRRIYALRQSSADSAGRNRTWRCHPRCDCCRFIPTPWGTPSTFGFVGINGGGE